jgi:hypothetical protein
MVSSYDQLRSWTNGERGSLEAATAALQRTPTHSQRSDESAHLDLIDYYAPMGAELSFNICRLAAALSVLHSGSFVNIGRCMARDSVNDRPEVLLLVNATTRSVTLVASEVDSKPGPSYKRGCMPRAVSSAAGTVACDYVALSHHLILHIMYPTLSDHIPPLHPMPTAESPDTCNCTGRSRCWVCKLAKVISLPMAFGFPEVPHIFRGKCCEQSRWRFIPGPASGVPLPAIHVR